MKTLALALVVIGVHAIFAQGKPILLELNLCILLLVL